MLKFILISIIVLYVFYKVMKYMMRWAFLFAGKKMQQKFEEAQQAQSSQRGGHYSGPTYKAGNVEVEIPVKPKPKLGKFKGGDYIDYEEVE